MDYFSNGKSTNNSPISSMQCGNNLLTFNKPLVMGILNATPDSFSDGGMYNQTESALIHIENMIAEGADIIDIGAVSTRPGSTAPDEREEIARVMPILKTAVKKHPQTVFSIDTYRANVAQIAADNGVGIINDISAGRMDNNLLKTVAQLKIPYILMHMQGNSPQTMQQNPVYTDVVEEVKKFFSEKTEILKNTGIENIILDPGFGFGKTITHNYQLLKNLYSLKTGNYPILSALSRKSMIYKVLEVSPQETLTGTATLTFISIINGADILRVHDVKETVQMIKLAEKYMTA